MRLDLAQKFNEQAMQRDPNVVLAHYPMSDTSLPARYARAISAYRYAGLQVSLPLMRAAIELTRPAVVWCPNTARLVRPA